MRTTVDGAKNAWKKRRERMMFEMEYECPCGEVWFMEHDCACNDRCPSCDKENEPVNVEDVE